MHGITTLRVLRASLMNETRRQLIAEFLRARRARITPQMAGLPSQARRRTPGLRREEVAVLAGVGASWYTWLEQGRNMNPSPQALARLARVLQLERDETGYLFELAGHAAPRQPAPLTASVEPSLRRVLDLMEQAPAYVLNRRWDRIAWNAAALGLFGDFTREPREQFNMVRRVFTNAPTRRYVVNWEEIAKSELAEFAASCAHHPDDPWIAQLVDELSAKSAEFRAWWPRRDVLRRRSRRALIRHRGEGVIALEVSSYQVVDNPELTLRVFAPLPEDDSPAKLRRAIRAYRKRIRSAASAARPTGTSRA